LRSDYAVRGQSIAGLEIFDGGFGRWTEISVDALEGPDLHLNKQALQPPYVRAGRSAVY
jgi:hypothetical protein